MPKSRKRKTRKGGVSSRSTYSAKKSNQMTKAIVLLVIAAMAVAAVLFIVLRSGGNGGSSATGEVTTASGLKYIEGSGHGREPKAGAKRVGSLYRHAHERNQI